MLACRSLAFAHRHRRIDNINGIMTEDVKNDDSTKEPGPRPDIYWMLSGVYCMFIVFLSLAVCSSHHSTQDVTALAVDVYFIILTLVGSIWLTTFKAVATTFGRYPERHEEVKSCHSANRWLKGILMIFGVAIIIKDVLDLLTTTQYTNPSCKKVVYFLAPISEIVFILTEVNFLFRYYKFHLQEHIALNRFGTMHVIATNLSIWILIIIEESMSSDPLTLDRLPAATRDPSTLNPTIPTQVAESNKSEIMEILNEGKTVGPPQMAVYLSNSYASEDLFGANECSCNTSYCEAVTSSHAYLYPFLVEFSLVASCMMYIVWKNIGTRPVHTKHSPKPSYKFYNSYKGMGLGVLILIVTVAIIIFVNYGIFEESDGKYYDSHVTTMITFNSYMVGSEVFMLISCFVGIALFRAEPRPLDVELGLDAVLLFVTLAGVMILDIYYVFSVLVSLISGNYDYTWIWGLIYPLVDLIQCIIQVGFILAGSARRPVVEDTQEHAGRSYTYSTSSCSDSGIHGFQNDVYETSDFDVSVDEQNGGSSKELPENEETMTDLNEIRVCENKTECTHPIRTVSKARASCKVTEENAQQTRNLQHCKRPRVAPPSSIRLNIRETLMFLLICNACLWTFWSLQAPTIKKYSYPNQYFSSNSNGLRNIWRSASTLCLPLAIFFRMHSCACLFEMWSFT